MQRNEILEDGEPEGQSVSLSRKRHMLDQDLLISPARVETICPSHIRYSVADSEQHSDWEAKLNAKAACDISDISVSRALLHHVYSEVCQR